MEVLSTSWHSYPKIYNLGHPYISDLFQDDVLIEEKVDGSQFSFGVFNGELKLRSKGQELVVDAPEKMFLKAVDYVKSIQSLLKDGWTYRAEYLAKPKHNTLNYERIPKNTLAVFDINSGEEKYLSYEEKKAEAERIGLEVVPFIFHGKVDNLEQFNEYLKAQSFLGNVQVEGVVVKNYNKFGQDKKVLLGKYVSELFKEQNKQNWKVENPSNGDISLMLCGLYKTEARWNKAIQHLREAGKLTDTPKDIGNLLKEIQNDVLLECEADAKEKLWQYIKPKIQRTVIQGFPEYYKQKLAETQFKTA